MVLEVLALDVVHGFLVVSRGVRGTAKDRELKDSSSMVNLLGQRWVRYLSSAAFWPGV